MNFRARWLALLVLAGIAWHELWIWMATGRIAGKATATHQDLEGVLFDPSRNPPWLVFLVVALLLAGRWRDLVTRTGPPGPAWATGALGVLAVGLLGWARFVSAPDLMIPAAGLGSLGLAWATGGAPRLKLLLVPTVLLLFAMPLPGVFVNRVVFPLQIWTAEYTTAVMHVLDLPLIQMGDVLRTPEKNFIVIEACSGMGSIEVLTLLSLAYAWFTRSSLLQGAILVASAPAIAFGLNGLRVVTMVLNPDSAIVSVHTTQGLIVFAVGALLIAVLDAWLTRILPRGGAEAADADSGSRHAPGIWALSLAAGAVFLSVVLPRYELPLPITPPQFLPDSLTAGGVWERQNVRADARFLGTVGFERYEFAELRRNADTEPVAVFLGIDERRSRQRSLWSDKNLRPGAGWHLEDVRQEPLPGRIDSTRLQVRSQENRRFTFTTYWNVESFFEELVRAVLGLDQSPFRRTDRAFVLRLGTSIGTGEGEEFQARRRAFAAATALNPLLLELIGPDQIRQLERIER